MPISKLSKDGAVRESASALIDKTNEVIDAVNASGGSDLILGIKDITRSGTTFTATRIDGTTFTFTQQDNNTTALTSMTGTLAIGHGGTGATSASSARSNLGVAPVSLWNGSSNGNITLSQSAANFTRITIYYNDNDNQCSSVDMYQPNGKLVILPSNWDGQFHKMRSVKINGTSVNTVRAYETDTRTGDVVQKNLIYITRVLGWYY